MKKYLYLVILLCFASAYIQAQPEQDQVIKTLNNFRKENSKKLFKLDSALLETNKLIEIKNINAQKIDKDSLRSLLRTKGNFDYNIEYFEVSYLKTKNIGNDIISKNEKLIQILNDSSYNNIGVGIETGLIKNKLKILATQNYVKFDDESSIIFHEMAGGYKQYYIVTGTAKIKNIAYNTYQYKNNYIKLESANKFIELDSNNRFEIKVDITKSNGKPFDIEITDSTGKVLSYIRNR